MLTRKQLNTLLQSAVFGAAYDHWICRGEGQTWQEERIARLVLACFKRPIQVWVTEFKEYVQHYQRGPIHPDTRIMPTLELLWDSLDGGQVPIHRARQAVRVMMDLPPVEHDAMCKLAKLANLNIVQVADKCSDSALTQLSSASSDLKQVCRGSRRSSNQVSVTRP